MGGLVTNIKTVRMNSIPLVSQAKIRDLQVWEWKLVSIEPKITLKVKILWTRVSKGQI